MSEFRSRRLCVCTAACSRRSTLRSIACAARPPVVRRTFPSALDVHVMPSLRSTTAADRAGPAMANLRQWVAPPAAAELGRLRSDMRVCTAGHQPKPTCEMAEERCDRRGKICPFRPAFFCGSVEPKGMLARIDLRPPPPQLPIDRRISKPRPPQAGFPLLAFSDSCVISVVVLFRGSLAIVLHA
jgi:hypothetical protein